jgi:hypothetical protein
VIQRIRSAWRTHGDLLVFQIGSWSSAQMLFAVFGAFAIHGALAHIAFVEVASAFFGTTFATIAFRMGFASPMKTRLLILARLLVLAGVAIAAATGLIAWTWVIGVAPSLLTPAHFPVIYGARKWAVAVLVGARALACVTCIALGLSSTEAFAVYFAPGIIYAIALYGLHFGDWTRPGESASTRHATAGGSWIDVFFYLPIASAGLFFIQASVVSSIAAASPAVAVIERLMRSSYSLAYPYLMRVVYFHTALRGVAGALAFALPVAAVALRSWPLLAICLPVCIDLVTTNLFRLGPLRLRVVALWVSVVVVVFVVA